ncbi:YqiA/YcfP family alpha/beta fold hydrolase [Moraxella catarrhalis]|uniref:YqiA/YcfP family alpha/beta fold hydrolase n=1 Tax=Moraxella catarrhalis TaxID=480 RepID=UPI0007E37D72|nr:YqiA/YcfP family alpha/beta fold hydrolase [Moraxella catarrhalis]OAV02518.1 putative esterase [Moraxella catarrhalis]
MKLIYLHGLDSDSNAIKAQITQTYCQANYPNIEVVRPNLNRTPDEVVKLLKSLIADDQNTVLIGSSLGGYFANLLSDLTGVPAVLLNPSIRPDISFRRFLDQNFDGHALSDKTVIYTTTGGWQITYGDLAWFERHRLAVKNPDLIKVLLKMGDELLDAQATQAFYDQKGVQVLAQAGGDHRISDYEAQVATVIDWAIRLHQR